MWKEPKVFAVKHKDYEVRMNSRSGGIFTALSDKILEKGGTVYGCVLSEDFRAIHVRAENDSVRDLMRGSKYVQSDLGDIFAEIKNDLEKQRKVLFSGTSCQVAGLKGYLGKNYNTLICVDIVCHGVPSPKVWNKYLHWQEDQVNGKCFNVDFRNKKDYGWSEHVETMEFAVGKRSKRVDSIIYRAIFYGHQVLRPCCYKCPYKATIHPGDITIADYWGIENAAPGFSDNNGVSLVLLNNAKGLSEFHDLYNVIDYRECRLEDSMQAPLIEPFDEPDDRSEFWNDFISKPFEYIVCKYGKINKNNTYKLLLKRIRYRVWRGK